MVAETQNLEVHRHDLHSFVSGVEADLEVRGLMTVKWAGIGSAKEKVGSGSSTQESRQLG